MNTREQFEVPKLGDRKTGGRHQARHTRDTVVRLSSPWSSSYPLLRQPVSTFEEDGGIHRYEASSFLLLNPPCVSHARPFPMLHHRCIGRFRSCKENGTHATLGLRLDDPPMLQHRFIGHFRSCKEDGTHATLGLRLDDPARCLWLTRHRPDYQDCSRKHSRVSSFIDVKHRIDKIGNTDFAFIYLLRLYILTW